MSHDDPVQVGQFPSPGSLPGQRAGDATVPMGRQARQHPGPQLPQGSVRALTLDNVDPVRDHDGHVRQLVRPAGQIRHQAPQCSAQRHS